jgi:ABC-2 type transport system permease protein
MIADRRFQHYQGKRLGVGYSFLRLVVHSIGWVLGLKRSARYKIVPAIFLAIAFLPSLALVIVAAVVPDLSGAPTYPDYLSFTLPAVYVFIAITMPELICPDRRHGTLRMYITSNLNPAVYLAAKIVAAWSVMALITVVPVLILLGGYSLVGHGPDGAGNWFKTLAEILASGFMLAIFYSTVALAISSLTDRNSFASAGIILTLILSGAALGILQGPLKAPDWVLLVNVNQLPIETSRRIYQLAASDGTTGVATWQVAAAVAGWVIACIGVLVLRYRGEGRK